MRAIVISPTIPPRLRRGDTVAVVAPSRSLAIIERETRLVAADRFRDEGLHLTFGANTEERDIFDSSAVSSRVDDWHAAFADPEVKAIFTVIGGFNANGLLRHLDWDLMRNNPKIVCGYSDITILNAALLAKSGLVSYSGPHYSSFGQQKGFDYSLEYWRKCLFSDEPFEIHPSPEWSDDKWYENQSKLNSMPNPGPLVLQEGEAEGVLIGTNLRTLRLAQGTEYFPDLNGAFLFLEDDHETHAQEFDRNLQAFLHAPEAAGVRGLAIGRFQKESKVTEAQLRHIVATKAEVRGLPVVANLDFGHTMPLVTLPIGGRVRLAASGDEACVEILSH